MLSKGQTSMTERIRSKDPWEQVLESITSLPEPAKGLESVAENYKAVLYGDLENSTPRPVHMRLDQDDRSRGLTTIS